MTLDHKPQVSDLQRHRGQKSGVQIKGGLQFSNATWQAFGGQGDAHQASREEQIAVAEKVQAEQGWGAWPACTKKLGIA
ncbi:transglycosylase family protein [Pseudonocardia sp. EC080625-04]|uniref:transglycosylase family protein n=1 Tax=Pseudonocardia sp. EC080625-04 TaxID=1096868 RepID=UPI0009E6D1FB|nr:transglycosylase family protein [Pseudonocardia sp. EC080625-04]